VFGVVISFVLSGRVAPMIEDPLGKTSQSLCQLYATEESRILPPAADRIARFSGAWVTKFVHRNETAPALHNVFAVAISLNGLAIVSQSSKIRMLGGNDHGHHRLSGHAELCCRDRRRGFVEADCAG
jgi:hypothetical protein